MCIYRCRVCNIFRDKFTPLWRIGEYTDIPYREAYV